MMQAKWLTAAVLAVASAVTAPAHALLIDGDSSDWLGIAPVATPEVADLGSLSFSLTGDTLYFLITGTAANVDGAWYGFGLDIDQNTATGCAFENGIGVEIGGYFVNPSFQNIGDASDCGWSAGDFGPTWSAAFTENGVEGSIALSNLALFGWNGASFDMVVTANGGWSSPFRVELAPTSVPVVPGLLLMLPGLLVLARLRRR